MTFLLQEALLNCAKEDKIRCCKQHGNSRSKWSFFQRKTKDSIWKVSSSFQDHMGRIPDPVSVPTKSQWEQVCNNFSKLLTPCLWTDLHLSVFAMLKNLLNGFVQKKTLWIQLPWCCRVLCTKHKAQHLCCVISFLCCWVLLLFHGWMLLSFKAEQSGVKNVK